MSDISQQLIDAQQALVNKDLDAANRIIVDLTTTHADDPNVRYLACLLLRLQGRNDEAMQSLQSLTSDVPRSRARLSGDDPRLLWRLMNPNSHMRQPSVLWSLTRH